MKRVALFMSNEAEDAHYFFMGGGGRHYGENYRVLLSALRMNPYTVFPIGGTHFLRKDFKGFFGTELCPGSGFRLVWSLLNKTHDTPEAWIDFMRGSSVSAVDFSAMANANAPLVVYIEHSAINYHRSIAEGNRKRGHDYRYFMDWWNNGGAAGKLKDSIDDWEPYGSLAREWGRTD